MYGSQSDSMNYESETCGRPINSFETDLGPNPNGIFDALIVMSHSLHHEQLVCFRKAEENPSA